MANQTIFYSWQSDTPNAVNRGFIEGCLQRAIDELKSDDDLELDPCLERDTSGVPGSPDIAATIFEKIKAADVFVGDVTFIDKGDGRRTPNPNVSVELGYAASCLDWNRVICVFNSAFGKVEDLPFDLRARRIVQYELPVGADKAEQRKSLVGRLRAGIQSILHAPDREAQEAKQEFLSSLASELILVIIFGEELDQRKINPWRDSVIFQFQNSAESLRELSLGDIANEHSLEAELRALSEMLDTAANLPMEMGSWPQFSSLVEQAVEKATLLKASHIDSLPISDDSVQEVRLTIQKLRKKLDNLASRAETLVGQGRREEAQEEASQIGQSILQIGLYNVDCIQTGLGDALQRIGHDLHLVETMQVSFDGGQSRAAIVDRIQKGSQALGTIIDSLGET